MDFLMRILRDIDEAFSPNGFKGYYNCMFLVIDISLVSCIQSFFDNTLTSNHSSKVAESLHSLSASRHVASIINGTSLSNNTEWSALVDDLNQFLGILVRLRVNHDV